MDGNRVTENRWPNRQPPVVRPSDDVHRKQQMTVTLVGWAESDVAMATAVVADIWLVFGKSANNVARTCVSDGCSPEMS
ncbi:unnamed protein product [Soboliphyme baturini]|uniref:Transposase n=1 Tax=Soboliphyme baturini TaxID=241478 RepID=A0A183IMF9_9BILA|nr:unnamed protein product [Soboliphyme baturini]